jgi:sugar phosphate isomerase/epimerase
MPAAVGVRLEALQIEDVDESADRLIELALRGGGPERARLELAMQRGEINELLNEATEEQLVGLLEDLVPLAEKHRLTIVIEALNRTECNIVLSLIEADHLAKRINHPRVQLLADYYHFAIEREPIEHVASVAKSIRHVHFSNPTGRGYTREADEHFTAFCRQLTASGYDDRMSIEAYSQDFECDAEATLTLMKRLAVSS